MTVRHNPTMDNWFFRFSRDRRSYFKGGFRTKKQAGDAQTKFLDRLIKGEIYPERTGEDMSFVEGSKSYYEDYAVKRKLSAATDKARIPVLNQFLEGKRLKDVTPEDVQRLRDFLKRKGLKDVTVNYYHVLLKAIFNWLRKNRKYRGDNPACFVKLEKVPTAHVRFLYPAEERILTPAVQRRPDLWPFYFVGLHTGMRLSEICRMRVRDVSLPMRTIFIPQSKSKTSRYVPMSEKLLAFIEQSVQGKGPEEPVLGPRDRYIVSHWFTDAVRSVKIDDFRFHDLRHTFASHLLSRGVPIYKVSKILGHGSVTVTEKHYGHMAMQELMDAVDRIDGIIPELHSSCIHTASQDGRFAKPVVTQ